MKTQIITLLSQALHNLDITFDTDKIQVSQTNDVKNGDFACTIALQLSKILQKNPREIAENLLSEIHTCIKKSENTAIEKIEIAGPGFLNFFISKQYYTNSLQTFLHAGENIGKTQRLTNKVFIAEHTDPNLFKEIHIGHVMTNVIGESFYRLAQFAGATVKNVTFQGDVGMHIAKALWGIQNIGEELPLQKTPYEKQKFLGKCYVFGEKHFSENINNAKNEITQINKEIYTIVTNPESNPDLAKIYTMGCKWSLEYLETIYEILGSKFDHYFLESSTFTDGERIVKENTAPKGKKVFSQPEKAIIFEGEKFGYHTRVFINSEGLPTYEAKDIGLFYKKWEKYNPDYSLTITGGDQKEYFTIVKEAAGLINPEWKAKTMHRAHGILKLKTGKMSSRTGGIIRAQEWIDEAKENVFQKMESQENSSLSDFSHTEKTNIAQNIAMSAIKYSILKVSAGKDIVYDEKVALDFSGNTGPYLLYSYVRANSILNKIENLSDITTSLSARNADITVLEKKFAQFESVLEISLETLSSHNLANYLYDIASEFSSFYAHTKIADTTNPDYEYNIAIISVFKNIMKNGLYCLGIKTVENM